MRLTRLNVNSLTLLPFPQCALATKDKKHVAIIDSARSCGKRYVQELSWEEARGRGYLKGLPAPALAAAEASPEGYALFIESDYACLRS